MKKVYIVLTHTKTILSRLIKEFTKCEFSHVSISLDVDLNKMYSFGRLNAYNPFFAGFVHEYINKGTFKRFYKTKTKVYSLNVTDEEYVKIENTINQIKAEKEKYKFNIIGLVAAGVHKKIGNDHSFYCAEFVKYVLENAGIKTNLPEIVKPEHFESLEDINEIYYGLLKKYRAPTDRLKDLIRENLLTYSNQKQGLI